MSKLLKEIWVRTPLSSTFRSSSSGVELPVESSEPLMKGLDKEMALDEPVSEKCELRIEGMTCGSCVEVGIIGLGFTLALGSKVFEGYRRHASTTGRHSFHKGCIISRTRSYRIRSKALECREDCRSEFLLIVYSERNRHPLSTPTGNI